jgi:hypothetical protein
LFGVFKLLSKCPVQLNPVSRAIYPVPTKNRIADPPTNPSDNGVPSSSNWYPTAALRRRIQNTAEIAAICTPVKPYEARQSSDLNTNRARVTDDYNLPVQREPPYTKDLTYLDKDIAAEEELHLSTEVLLLVCREEYRRSSSITSAPQLLPSFLTSTLGTPIRQ